MKILSSDLVCASSHEEFFWKDSDIAVMEGVPVGIDLEVGDRIDFILFEDIYWKDEDEDEKETENSK